MYSNRLMQSGGPKKMWMVYILTGCLSIAYYKSKMSSSLLCWCLVLVLMSVDIKLANTLRQSLLISNYVLPYGEKIWLAQFNCQVTRWRPVSTTGRSACVCRSICRRRSRISRTVECSTSLRSSLSGRGKVPSRRRNTSPSSACSIWTPTLMPR